MDLMWIIIIGAGVALYLDDSAQPHRADLPAEKARHYD